MKFSNLVFNVSSHGLYTIILSIVIMQCIKIYAFTRDSQNVQNVEAPDSIFKMKNTYKIKTKSLEDSSSYTSEYRYTLNGSILRNLNENTFSSDERIVHLNKKGIDEPGASVSAISFTNLLQRNKLVNLSKKVLFLHLVFSCNVFNLMLISYLMSKNASLFKKCFSKNFLQFHLGLNLTILVKRFRIIWFLI